MSRTRFSGLVLAIACAGSTLQSSRGLPHRVFLLLLILIATPATADTELAVPDSPRAGGALQVPLADGIIQIDGLLNEATWESSLRMDLGYETSPGENTPAPVHTEVFLTYDQRFLYVAFRCRDPEPDAIRAYLHHRDDAWNDDGVTVRFDTFHDRRRAFNFGVNPLGVQMDFAGPSGSEDVAWDAIWSSSAEIGDSGWCAELAIPFTSLSFARTDRAQIWGFIASRHYPRDQEYWTSTVPVDRGSNCDLCKATEVSGFAGVDPGHAIVLIPTVTAIRADEDTEGEETSIESRPRMEVGATVRYRLSSNLSLSAAIRPDFSQVEADAFQLNVNEPFALYHEEHRPFFTEKSDFYRSRVSMVHTRTMHKPEWGLNLTGKEGSTSVGAIVVRDEETNLILPGNQSSATVSIQQRTTAGILRLKRDLGERITLGFLSTSRLGDEYHNHVFGVDASCRITDRHRIDVDVLGSRTEYPSDVSEAYGQPSGEFGSDALDVSYVYAGRKLEAWGGLAGFGGGFRADLGYVPQVDYKRGNVGCGYTWFPREASWWASVDLNAGYTREESRDGALLKEIGNIYLNYSGALQSWFSPVVSRRRQEYGGRLFRLESVSLSGGLRPFAGLSVWGGITVGDEIDYSNGRLGEVITIAQEAAWNPWSSIEVGVHYDYQRMNVHRERLYDANTVQARTALHLDRNTQLRTILQYNRIRFNTSNYAFEIASERSSVRAQILFSYELNPFSVIYLGYNAGIDKTGKEDPSRSEDTIFLKIGYAWSL